MAVSCLSKKKYDHKKTLKYWHQSQDIELQTTRQNVQSLASNENPACYGVTSALFHSLLSDYNYFSKLLAGNSNKSVCQKLARSCNKMNFTLKKEALQ